MSKWTDRMIRFMYGRYGADALYKFCMVLFWISFVGNLFWGSDVLRVLNMLLVLVILFRLMSRNHEKRRRENEAYLKFTAPIRSFFSLQHMRIRERKTKRFRRCPYCKTILRLPIKTGKHVVSCPVCHRDVSVTIRH